MDKKVVFFSVVNLTKVAYLTIHVINYCNVYITASFAE